MDAALRRRMTARALAGMAPTAEQAAAYDASAPNREAAGNALGGLGLELTGVPQVGRAISGIGEAVSDPSIPNITNAGVQTSMAALRPMLAAKILLGGYGAGLAKDLNASPISSAEAQSDPLDPASRARLNALQSKQQKGQTLTRAEREEQNGYLSTINSAATEAAKANASAAGKAAELKAAREDKDYNDAVARAKAERTRIMGGAREFKDSEVGKIYEKTGGWTPALAALAGGAIHRLGVGHTGNKMIDYGLPAAEGTALAFGALNAPLIYNATSTPAENPERKALEAYARELPNNHPRKQEFMDYAAQLPVRNPVQQAASEDLTSIPQNLRRLMAAVVEGGPGGLLGSKLPPATAAIGNGVRRAIEGTAETVGGLPASVATGHYRKAGEAATERGNAAIARQVAADSEATALEAQRRLGEQKAAPPTAPEQVAPPVRGQLPPPAQGQLPPPAPVQNPLQPPPQIAEPIVTPPQQFSKVDEIWGKQYSPHARQILIDHLNSGGSLVKGARAKDGGLTVENLNDSIKQAAGGKGPGRPTTGSKLDYARELLGENPTAKDAIKKLKGVDPRNFAVPLVAGAGLTEAARQMLVEELMRGQQ